MKLSRRVLLLGSAALLGGGLVLSWRRGGHPGLAGEGLEPSAYLQITPQGEVVLQVDKAEIGQGVMTGFVTLAAEELDLPPDRIEARLAPVHPQFQDPVQLTGESRSMRTRWLVVRETAAAAREMLLAAAAARWSVPREAVASDGQGHVVNARSGERLAYGALVAAAAALPVPDEVPLKPRSAFRWIGGSVPRPDAPAKVKGEARYGLDTQLPDMAVAIVLRAPDIGGELRQFDAVEARRMPGVRRVLSIPSGVAVVADNFWQAREAGRAVRAFWRDGPLAATDTADIERQLAAALRHEDGDAVRDDGDVNAGFGTAARVVEAAYSTPYLAHATMEPMNATVWFHAGGCEAWVPTQAPDLARQVVCDMADLPRDRVVVHSTYAGGGFGRRALTDYVAEAAAIALQVDYPVKLVWTREDDIRHGYFRQATQHEIRAALDATNQPVAWQHRLVAAGLSDQVLPPSLATLAPDWVPAGVNAAVGEAGTWLMERIMGAWQARDGAVTMPYAIPNVRVNMVLRNPGVPVTIWRSVGLSYNSFVVESFCDELAHAAGADPLAFRRKLLTGQPRLLAVLERVAAEAAWGQAPAGHFQGLALQAGFGTIVGQVAEVSVDEQRRIRVHRVTCVVDCGIAINPDVVRQQMEGGILFGLTAALYGRIDIREGSVVQGNFDTYRVLGFAEAPAIRVAVMPSDEEPSGVGEIGTPPIAPAVANAVFAATGERLRALPLRLPPKPAAAG